jgi:hypothetical protein
MLAIGDPKSPWWRGVLSAVRGYRLTGHYSILGLRKRATDRPELAILPIIPRLKHSERSMGRSAANKETALNKLQQHEAGQTWTAGLPGTGFGRYLIEQKISVCASPVEYTATRAVSYG